MIKKAQSAIEFMMIIGIAFTMLIPALFIFQQFGSQANEQVISAQINGFGREMITAIESMYYYGESSRTTIEFNFPRQINDMQINTPINQTGYYELVIEADLYGGDADFVYFTRVPIANESYKINPEPYFSNLDADISPRRDAFARGVKKFRIEAIKGPKDNLVVTVKRIVQD